MSLTVTQYHYLVVVQQLSQQLEIVRSIDVAVELGVARATTSRMINYLVDDGWLLRHRRALSLSSKAQTLLKESDDYYQILYRYFSKMNLDAMEIKLCTKTLCEHLQSSTINKICSYVKSHEE